MAVSNVEVEARVDAADDPSVRSRAAPVPSTLRRVPHISRSTGPLCILAALGELGSGPRDFPTSPGMDNHSPYVYPTTSGSRSDAGGAPDDRVRRIGEPSADADLCLLSTLTTLRRTRAEDAAATVARMTTEPSSIRWAHDGFHVGSSSWRD